MSRVNSDWPPDGGTNVDAGSSSGTILFTTSTNYSGAFGVALADAECARLAARAGLPGAYIAVLSYSGTTAVERVGPISYPVVRPDGVVLEWTDLWDGTGIAASLVNEDENAPASAAWWTGSTSTGGVGSTHCSSWTHGFSTQRGVAGFDTGATWLGHSGTGSTCNSRRSLLCIRRP